MARRRCPPGARRTATRRTPDRARAFRLRDPIGAPGRGKPAHPFQAAAIPQALQDAESYQIDIEGIPWTDVHRAWELSQQSLRYADAIYVAAAERHQDALLTSDNRIERSGAGARCRIITVAPAEAGPAGADPPTPRDQQDLVT